jgi:hypothetical protein
MRVQDVNLLEHALMQQKLTITLDEAVYDGLHRVIGRRRIRRFIEELVRAHILAHELEGTVGRGRAGGRRGHRAALPRRLTTWRCPPLEAS